VTGERYFPCLEREGGAVIARGKLNQSIFTEYESREARENRKGKRRRTVARGEKEKRIPAAEKKHYGEVKSVDTEEGWRNA